MSIFNKVQLTRPKRSTFNLSHTSKLTSNAGTFIPIYWNYFEPYSKFKVSTELMCRMLPMTAPIMHRLNIYTYWFKWPIRLGFSSKDCENFFTGGADGLASVEYPKYWIDVTTTKGQAMVNNILPDYLDAPGGAETITVGLHTYYVLDAMPFWCYYECWKNFFADKNTTTLYDIEDYRFTGVLKLDPLTDPALFAMHEDIIQAKAVCWEKDYFTSALPEPQRGTDVRVPFTVLSELAMNGTSPSVVRSMASAADQIQNIGADFDLDPTSQGTRSLGDLTTEVTQTPAQLDVTPHTKVVSQVLGTINDFRISNRLQRWFERNAVGGARYIEAINAHYGVWADDYRLQRPEYLGGSRTPISISEVLQTSQGEPESPQGEMAGRGFTMDKNGFVHAKMKEFCIIMGFAVIKPKPGYFQGMPRKWNIRDRFDFPWPEFGHLGEQSVYKDELYYVGGEPHKDTHESLIGTEVSNIFGYQSRYAQYKYEPNRVHTDFRSNLRFWHLARYFNNFPSLNRQFLTVDYNKDNLNRIFAVTDGSLYDGCYPYLLQFGFNMFVKRPLPYFGTPTL